MEPTKQQQIFLNIIEPSCLRCGKNTRILPSVLIGLAVKISKWGTDNTCALTKNLYKLTIDDNWFGKCYSYKSKKIYDKVSDCTEDLPMLLKVYENERDSVEDFANYLSTVRRSDYLSPLKYNSIIGCLDYKKSINFLEEAGFLQSVLNIYDKEYLQIVIGLIENYELYKYDDDLKSEIQTQEVMMATKKKKKVHVENVNQANNKVSVVSEEQKNLTETGADGVKVIAIEDPNDTVDINDIVGIEVVTESEIEKEPTIEHFEHMYRVRLDWDKPMTQIFASPIYEDAREVALQHEGYKIYIDDDGDLFEDPWIKPEEIEEIVATSNIKSVTHPVPGSKVILNNTPVYASASSKSPFAYLTGEFYYYDYSVVKGRAKITKSAKILKPNPSLILGYMDI